MTWYLASPWVSVENIPHGSRANELCCLSFSCPWGPSLAYLGGRYLGGGGASSQNPLLQSHPSSKCIRGSSQPHRRSTSCCAGQRSRESLRGAGEGRQTDGQAERQTQTGADRHRDRNRERQIDRERHTETDRDRQTETETDRQRREQRETGRDTQRQTRTEIDRQTQRQTDRDGDRQVETHRDRHRQR